MADEWTVTGLVYQAAAGRMPAKHAAELAEILVATARNEGRKFAEVCAPAPASPEAPAPRCACHDDGPPMVDGRCETCLWPKAAAQPEARGGTR